MSPIRRSNVPSGAPIPEPPLTSDLSGRAPSLMQGSEAARNLIRGAFDLHVHAAPDIVPRKCDDLTLARLASQAGMAGFLLKSHLGSTAERAYLVNQVQPGIHVAGGLVLNDSIGGLNPAAVDVFLRLGARCVWMPTQSSSNHKQRKGKPGPGISVLDELGKVVPVVHEICALIAAADAVLATGHLSVAETLALVPVARSMGVKRILVTHAELDDVSMPAAVQVELGRVGCFIEHSLICIHPAGGSVNFGEIARNIRATGPGSCVITTDYGQPDNPFPAQGLVDFVDRLLRAGFTETDIRQMATGNPLDLISAAQT